MDISRLICSHQAHTPYAIFATPDGERTMFGRHFDIMRGQPVEELPACRVFTLDPYCRELAIKAAVAARDAGFTNVAMDALRRPEIAACADLIVTSYQEANPKASDDELADMACAAAREHEAEVVITLGARIARCRAGREHHPSPGHRSGGAARGCNRLRGRLPGRAGGRGGDGLGSAALHGVRIRRRRPQPARYGRRWLHAVAGRDDRRRGVGQNPRPAAYFFFEF